MLEAAFTITDWLDMVGLYFVMSYLRDLQLVTLVRTLIIVGETLGAHEVVVGRGRGDDVAVAGDLAGEALHGAGHCFRQWLSQVYPVSSRSVPWSFLPW